jgi:hypothetical protein
MSGPGRSVGIATGYGLDDPGIEMWAITYVYGRKSENLRSTAAGKTRNGETGRRWDTGKYSRWLGSDPSPPIF